MNLNTKMFPTWCPGCGDFGIWASLKAAIQQSGYPLHQVVVVFDVGCCGNMSNNLRVYGFHGLHGRAVPAATGVKLANHHLKVIVVGGDGGLLGEGLTHFVSAARANQDMTILLHNNQVYGLTTGQSSPTSLKGTKGKATPLGVVDQPIDPCSVALVSGATFVSRGFASDIAGTTKLLKAAIQHPGFSLVEVLQPCVTFNKVNTYSWFRDRVKLLDKAPNSLGEAIDLAAWTEKGIHLGIFRKDANSIPYHANFEVLKNQTLIQNVNKRDLSKYITA